MSARKSCGIPRKSSCIAFVSHVDRGVLKLFELVKKSDLEGVVVKRKDGNMRRRRFGTKS